MSASNSRSSVQSRMSKADFDRLWTFLADEASAHERMPLPAVEGLFAAIAIGPGLTLPSLWLPLVFGGGAEAIDAEISALLLRFYNEVLEEIAAGNFEPLVVDRDGAKRSALMAALWASGFVEAMRINLDAWTPIVGTNAGAQAEVIVDLALTLPDNKPRSRFKQKSAEKLAARLVDSVRDVAAFWKSR